jgi:NADH:ubiquinone oxidoreductase subunit
VLKKSEMAWGSFSRGRSFAKIAKKWDSWVLCFTTHIVPKRDVVTREWRKLHNEELSIITLTQYFSGDEI